MPKQHTAFVCQECGYDSPAYLGKCPECGAWNSFKEIRLGPSSKQQKNVSSRSFLASDIQPEPLNSVAIKPTVRFSTGFVEMDNVLGGGVVPGSAILVAGDPGIGKSTLLLQMCLYLAEEGKKVL